ncbi:stage II sporulation protein M [Luteolibacter sp. LG18]|uniref:stage II sporulation protein M n=1 Tax=Luteolibacter sp. LG18 TaxID=2819286 RepID=UPI002B28A5CA|nr:hypothetical protein llg_45590 [Luteolibacter sp. LG18]
MTSGEFENRNAARWAEYERLVDAMERGQEIGGVERLPQRFRELCLDHSLVQARMYGIRLGERLNALVIRGYKLIYRSRRHGWESVVRMAAVTFPATVRKEWRLFWLCSAVFWIPFLLLVWVAKHDLTWIQSILGSQGMAQMEEMYGGDSPLAKGRPGMGSDFMMFCFYIQHNIGIDFSIFAGGILAGLGTLFYLFFNGLHIGAAAGYCNAVCNPQAFWSFVAGHSSFELTGMVISGMAGMRMGLAILWPGRLPRVRALVEATKKAMPLIYGAAVMTACAAVLEGFWSAQPLTWLPGSAYAWKYSVGAVLWLLHIVYFLFAGRRAGDAA